MGEERSADLPLVKKLEIGFRAIQFENLQRFKPTGLAYRSWKGVSGGVNLGYENVWMPEWEYQGKQGKGKINRYKYGLRRSDEFDNLEVSANYQWSPDNDPRASVLVEQNADSLELRWKGADERSINPEQVDVILHIAGEHWWVVQTVDGVKVHTGRENELCSADNNKNNLREINRLIAGMANFRFYPDLQTTKDLILGVAHAVLTKTRPATKLPVG